MQPSNFMLSCWVNPYMASATPEYSTPTLNALWNIVRYVGGDPYFSKSRSPLVYHGGQRKALVHLLSSGVPQARHHTYKGCPVMILGSHTEVPGSMLESIRQNYCEIHEKLMYPAPYLRLRRGVHHSEMWCSLWCTTVLSHTESRASGLASTKGNNFEETYAYAWWIRWIRWIRTTSSEVRDGPLIIKGRGQTEIPISLFYCMGVVFFKFWLTHALSNFFYDSSFIC